MSTKIDCLIYLRSTANMFTKLTSGPTPGIHAAAPPLPFHRVEVVQQGEYKKSGYCTLGVFAARRLRGSCTQQKSPGRYRGLRLLGIREFSKGQGRQTYSSRARSPNPRLG